MTAQPGLTLSRMTDRDLEAAYELSEEAGWNQTYRDWERILELDPEGLIGGYRDGELVGTVTLVSLGDDVAWIGMMLVREAFRGVGFGHTLFREALREARTRGHSLVGLDATHLGLPLYRSEGFQAVTSMTRWGGTLASTVHRDPSFIRLPEERFEEAVELDHHHSGVDRRRLLRTLLQETTTVAVGAFQGERLRGFGLSRPGRKARHIGPVLAESPEMAGRLIGHLGHEFPDTPVLIDLCDRPEMDRQLLALGLEPQRRLTRMTWPVAQPVLDSPAIPVIVSFEWG